MAGNVAGLLEAAARSRPDKQVLISGDSARDWRTLERRAGGFAARLVQDGLKPGDRIALDCAAPLDQVTAFIGGLKAGAVVAPLNPRLTHRSRHGTYHRRRSRRACRFGPGGRWDRPSPRYR